MTFKFSSVCCASSFYVQLSNLVNMVFQVDIIDSLNDALTCPLLLPGKVVIG